MVKGRGTTRKELTVDFMLILLSLQSIGSRYYHDFVQYVSKECTMEGKTRNLKSKVTKLKQKFKETVPPQPTTSTCARIPRSLSV